MSARSIPAFGWNVACVCVPSLLVTPAGDVDGPRPRPRALGTLPLGTARPGPSSLPRAHPEAGSGRGWPEAWCPVGPWLWSLRVPQGEPFPCEEELDLPVGSRPSLLFLITRRGKPSESQSNRIFRAHTSPLTPKRSHRDLLVTSRSHYGMSRIKKGQTLALPRRERGRFQMPLSPLALADDPELQGAAEKGAGEDLRFPYCCQDLIPPQSMCAASGNSCPYPAPSQPFRRVVVVEISLRPPFLSLCLLLLP